MGWLHRAAAGCCARGGGGRSSTSSAQRSLPCCVVVVAFSPSAQMSAQTETKVAAKKVVVAPRKQAPTRSERDDLPTRDPRAATMSERHHDVTAKAAGSRRAADRMQQAHPLHPQAAAGKCAAPYTDGMLLQRGRGLRASLTSSVSLLLCCCVHCVVHPCCSPAASRSVSAAILLLAATLLLLLWSGLLLLVCRSTGALVLLCSLSLSSACT